MKRGLLFSIIVLPGTVMVFIPLLLIRLSRGSNLAASLAHPYQPAFWLGLLAILIGVALAISTSRLFIKEGDGTPAPWDPPKKFVVRGPYRYVRNPMISGALFILAGEALLLQSIPIAMWMLVFYLFNALYIPFVEERDLEKRFGAPYLEYKRNVRRWVPRVQPWNSPQTTGTEAS